jgi:uncharacterized membrane protein
MSRGQQLLLVYAVILYAFGYLVTWVKVTGWLVRQRGEPEAQDAETWITAMFLGAIFSIACPFIGLYYAMKRLVIELG